MRGTAPLLEVQDLTVHFNSEEGTVEAVDGVSFTVEEGDSFALVGESGAGKSVTALSIMGLVQTPPGEIVSGEVRFRGTDLLSIPREELNTIRGDGIGMVFQDPETSLNPVHKVGRQIAESIRIHNDHVDEDAAWDRAVEMLDRVGIPNPTERAEEFPHQFSGGMQQRVIIAMALANDPDLLIADEPTTALDVTTEATILELIEDLQDEFGMSMILITHDLSVVSEMCDRVGIMYAGSIVELGDIRSVYTDPMHPYTHGLLSTVLDPTRAVERVTPLEGMMPSAADKPSGCPYHPRCPAAMEGCDSQDPPLIQANDRRVACHLYPEPISTPGDRAQVSTELPDKFRQSR